MFTEKEVTIVKALAEEETAKAARSNSDSSVSGLVIRYIGTLTGIVGKLDRLESSYKYVPYQSG